MAGCDLLLLPSRFESCGLTQMYAQRYGALPVVHRVGGLADTVVDADAAALAEDRATGFVFDAPSAEALAAALQRAADLYAAPRPWRQLQQRAMQADFSWGAPARDYLALYEQALQARAQRPRGIDA